MIKNTKNRGQPKKIDPSRLTRTWVIPREVSAGNRREKIHCAGEISAAQFKMGTTCAVSFCSVAYCNEVTFRPPPFVHAARSVFRFFRTFAFHAFGLSSGLRACRILRRCRFCHPPDLPSRTATRPVVLAVCKIFPGCAAGLRPQPNSPDSHRVQKHASLALWSSPGYVVFFYVSVFVSFPLRCGSEPGCNRMWKCAVNFRQNRVKNVSMTHFIF